MEYMEFHLKHKEDEKTDFTSQHYNACRLYFIISFQFYLCEVMGTILGTGAILKQDMLVHHAAVMACMCLGYHFQFLSYGIMWMALFDVRCGLHLT
jgi:hypothetical protein